MLYHFLCSLLWVLGLLIAYLASPSSFFFGQLKMLTKASSKNRLKVYSITFYVTSSGRLTC